MCGRDWSSDVCSSDLLTALKYYIMRQIQEMAASYDERGTGNDLVIGQWSKEKNAIDEIQQ